MIRSEDFDWITRRHDLTPMARLLLLQLWSYVNHRDEQPVAWPTIPTLAESLGLTERGVYKTLSDLREAGLVERREGWPITRDGGRVTLPFAFLLSRPPLNRDAPLNSGAPTPELEGTHPCPTGQSYLYGTRSLKSITEVGEDETRPPHEQSIDPILTHPPSKPTKAKRSKPTQSTEIDPRAKPVLDYVAELREELHLRPLDPTEATDRCIVALLKKGVTVDLMLDVVAARADEVEADPTQAEWFNPTSLFTGPGPRGPGGWATSLRALDRRDARGRSRPAASPLAQYRGAPLTNVDEILARQRRTADGGAS